MFLATLFTIAEHWKTTQCPSVGEQINTLWFRIENINKYTKNQLSINGATWMTLKGNMLSARSQTPKVTSVGFHSFDGEQIWGCQGLGTGGKV